MEETKYRISGIHNQLGKVVYLHYTKYKNKIFYNFNKKPSDYKKVGPSEFMEIQLICQTEMSNVIWETNNRQLIKRYQIGAKNARLQ